MKSVAELSRVGRVSTLYVSLAVVIAFCFDTTASASQTCRREEAIKAETEASTLTTWPKVFESYGHYRHCDDGAISEGYSNSVATLLASHWDQFDELRSLVGAHPKFQAFVLRHVNETMTLDQGNSIKENVHLRCPANGKALCESIMARLSNH
jgi:hypothetical protein